MRFSSSTQRFAQKINKWFIIVYIIWRFYWLFSNFFFPMATTQYSEVLCVPTGWTLSSSDSSTSKTPPGGCNFFFLNLHQKLTFNIISTIFCFSGCVWMSVRSNPDLPVCWSKPGRHVSKAVRPHESVSGFQFPTTVNPAPEHAWCPLGWDRKNLIKFLWCSRDSVKSLEDHWYRVLLRRLDGLGGFFFFFLCVLL